MDAVSDKANVIFETLRNIGGDLLRLTWGVVVAVGIIVLVTWLGGRLRRRLRQIYPNRLEKNSAAIALVDNLFRIFVVIIGIVLALGIVGVPTSSLVTWVGVIVAALSLSLQSIIQNLVAGFYLLIEQPFAIGDRITVNTQTGTVQSVALRITVMRNARKEMVMVPNYVVFTEAVRAKIGLAPECLVVVVQPVDIPAATPGDVFSPILSRLIGQVEFPPVYSVDSIRPEGVSVTIRMWLDDIDRQQNEILAAFHERFPDARIEVVEDLWTRQIIQMRSG